jgi:hypothetical protein
LRVRSEESQHSLLLTSFLVCGEVLRRFQCTSQVVGVTNEVMFLSTFSFASKPRELPVPAHGLFFNRTEPGNAACALARYFCNEVYGES